MIPIYRTDQIKTVLADAFENRYKRRDVNITGILLARPEDPICKKEILPHLNYWHHRSDYYTEFFCIGYTPDRPFDVASPTPVTHVGGSPWYFSDHAFTEFLAEFEEQVNWTYDSQPYLLITNTRYDAQTKKADLDFGGAMIVNIADAVKTKAVASASQLADRLFDFAKRINEDTTDPVWEFSDELGVRVVKGTLKNYLMALLPKEVRKGTKQAIHFVARDLRPA